MTASVPKYIAKRYVQGAHGFRMEKRAQLRQLQKALDELRTGCAYFPCGEFPVDEITKQVEILRESLKVKNWGR